MKNRNESTMVDIAIILLAIAAFWAIVSTAECQEPCAQEVPAELRGERVKRKGKKGFWLHSKIYSCILHDLEQGQKQVAAKERVIYRLDMQLAECKRATKYLEGRLNETAQANRKLSTSLMELSQSPPPRQPIIQSPVLWGAIGLAIGGGAMYFVLR